MTLPSNYSANKARVSSIVDRLFPFGGEDLRRFKNWLKSKKIDYDAYMLEASSAGTFIHKQLEDHAMGYYNEEKHPVYSLLVEQGKLFMKEKGVATIETEKYVASTLFQGTIDLICQIDEEEWIVDWKSYGVAKHKWNIDSKWRKPYGKLKKATIQLSLYAYATGIQNIAVVELCKDGYHFHKLNRMTDIEVEALLTTFTNDNPIQNNKENTPIQDTESPTGTL